MIIKIIAVVLNVIAKAPYGVWNISGVGIGGGTYR